MNEHLPFGSGDHRAWTPTPKPTLGALMANYRNTNAIPPPLDAAIEKTWGYESEVGRHLHRRCRAHGLRVDDRYLKSKSVGG
jgi:hypothetical protein